MEELIARHSFGHLCNETLDSSHVALVRRTLVCLGRARQLLRSVDDFVGSLVGPRSRRLTHVVAIFDDYLAEPPEQELLQRPHSPFGTALAR